tara:strand:+ start:93 stop:377 length:285 start_codon:yes stop_codon:yes gene_type:complete
MNVIIQKLLILVIKFYKFFISPLLGSRCRFLPTCSEYFIEALKVYGIIKGSKLGFKRIFKCHPYKKLGGSHGLDFVPVSSSTFKNIKIKKGSGK